MRETVAAMRYLDEVVTDVGGTVLRYGGFYGASNDAMVDPVRKRQFPIVGDGAGMTSFIHLDDAAAATVLAIEHGEGIYNIVDDEPAPVREWLPVLAEMLGAKPPRHVPRWLGRLFAGEALVMMQTESRARPTPRRSASSAGTCATPAGVTASPPPTRPRARRAPRPLDRGSFEVEEVADPFGLAREHTHERKSEDELRDASEALVDHSVQRHPEDHRPSDEEERSERDEGGGEGAIQRRGSFQLVWEVQLGDRLHPGEDGPDDDGSRQERTGIPRRGGSNIDITIHAMP